MFSRRLAVAASILAYATLALPAPAQDADTNATPSVSAMEAESLRVADSVAALHDDSDVSFSDILIGVLVVSAVVAVVVIYKRKSDGRVFDTGSGGGSSNPDTKPKPPRSPTERS